MPVPTAETKRPRNFFQMHQIGSINMDQLNSIGKLSELYKDFIDYVNTFLNYEEGFSSIYILEEQFDINNGDSDTNILSEIFTFLVK